MYGAAAGFPAPGPPAGICAGAWRSTRLGYPNTRAVTSRFRAALEDHGISTGSCWHEQLDLCMIGVIAMFGWEKALGDGGEVSWWEATAASADRRPGRLMPMGAPRVVARVVETP